jgi:hypothetical protein
MWSIFGKITDGMKEKYSQKICPVATLSITNPTRTGPGQNPPFRSEVQATNRLNPVKVLKIKRREKVAEVYSDSLHLS